MADTPHATRTREALQQNFPGRLKISSNVGVCRKIKHSESYSQHSWGNALDIYGTAEHLARAHSFLLANRDALSINTLCYNGEGGCTTDHKDHIHADFWPKGLNVPPCAGGQSTYQAKDGTITGEAPAKNPRGASRLVRPTAVDADGIPIDGSAYYSGGSGDLHLAATSGAEPLRMFPSELRQIGCQQAFEFAKNVIAHERALTPDQRRALKDRLADCADRPGFVQGLDSLIFNPDDFADITGAAIAGATPLDEIVGFLGKLTDPNVWLRLAAGVAGVVVATVGLAALAKSQGVSTPAALKAVPGVGLLAGGKK